MATHTELILVLLVPTLLRGNAYKALDEVYRREYKRLSGQGRKVASRAKRYTLLSYRKKLDLEGRRARRKWLQFNHRLNTAYPLNEVFGQALELPHRTTSLWLPR